MGALLVGALGDTVVSLLPIVAVLLVFQVGVIRRPIPHLRRVIVGFVLIVLGMTLFLTGLEEALFPLGRSMAAQLTAPEFLSGGGFDPANAQWTDFGWVYVFGAAMGFATTIAEPALIAVAGKAEDISGGSIPAFGLRLAVAAGVAIGVALGCFRIVTGTSLPLYIIAGYAVVAVQAMRAPREIVALAFDTGGVTTSTVTVPVVAALGLGLASAIPGRSPLIDGFGLIAFASLFPMMTVLGYAQLGRWFAQRAARRRVKEG